jgi:hypothetical protein
MRDHAAMIAAIAARGRLPFDWDGNCCVGFSAAIVEAATGRSIDFGHRWTTAIGATRVLKRLGGMEAAVTAVLRPIAPGVAQRGDVAGVPDPVLGLRLMIVEGVTLVGPGTAGAMREPRAAMTHAWSAD